MIWFLIFSYTSSGTEGTQKKMCNNVEQYIFYLIREIYPVPKTKSRDPIDDKLILRMLVFYNSEVAAKG